MFKSDSVTYSQAMNYVKIPKDTDILITIRLLTVF